METKTKICEVFVDISSLLFSSASHNLPRKCACSANSRAYCVLCDWHQLL